VIAAAVVVALVAAGLVAFFLLRDGGVGKSTIPNVAGLPAAEAKAQLEAEKLEVRTAGAASADVPQNQAIGTRPPAGTKVDRNAVVTLVVSKGPQEVEVPDVTGDPADNAAAALSQKGFEVARADDQFSDSVPSGSVISQDPKGGVNAAPGSTVTLTVSKGVEQVSVPSLRGVSLEVARTRLGSAGLEVGSVTPRETDAQPANTVLEQDPGATAQVSKGSSVDLVVSQEPKVQQITVPNVVGEDANTASQKLRGLGFNVISEGATPQNNEPEGQVIAQFPTAGTKVPEGRSVTITVSLGPPTTGSAPPLPTSPSGGGSAPPQP
jgi:serine/threonine-protein kinase